MLTHTTSPERRRRHGRGGGRTLVEVVVELQAGGGPLLPVEVELAVEAQRESIVHRGLEGSAQEAFLIEAESELPSWSGLGFGLGLGLGLGLGPTLPLAALA